MVSTADRAQAIEDVLADLTLTGMVPAWRPETGYLFFGERDEHYFAWLPAVPQGKVEATITIAGQRTECVDKRLLVDELPELFGAASRQRVLDMNRAETAKCAHIQG